MTKSDINKALSELRTDVEAHYAYLGLFAGQSLTRNMMSGIIDKLDTLLEQHDAASDKRIEDTDPRQLGLRL